MNFDPSATQPRNHGKYDVRLNGDVANGTSNDTMGSSDHLLAPLEPVALEDRGRGDWRVDETSVTGTANRFTITIGGIAALRVRNEAAAASYRDENSNAVDTELDCLAAKGSNVTLLMVDSSGGVSAKEVRLSEYGDGLAYRAKGASTKGWVLDKSRVLDVVAGYGGQQALAEAWAENKAETTPRVETVNHGGFDDLPTDQQDKIAAVYMVEHPGFGGGKEVGCMFLATDVQIGDGPDGSHIVNGYFWAPGGGELTSEHGSMYSHEIVRRGGKMTDYKPGSLTFGECFDDLPDDREAAYRRVLGK